MTGPTRFLIFLLAAACFVFTAADAAAQADRDVELLVKVRDRLLAADDAVRERGIEIRFEISDRKDPVAGVDFDGQRKNAYVVLVSRGMMEKIVRDEPDPLAFILAHEMAHITGSHLAANAGKTEWGARVYSRQSELEADIRGMELVVRAEYSYKRALECLKRMNREGGTSSFESLSMDHPTWTDRLAQLDANQAQLWHAMGAFEDGVYFANEASYLIAEKCFLHVTEEFPKCYEAWANLGYARLMRYIDKLRPEDLEDFGTGYFVTGAMYRKPSSLEEQTRTGGISGIDENLWYDAVFALRSALNIKSDLALVLVNLGIAALVDRSGTPDGGEAMKRFSEAMVLARNDSTLDASARYALYFNAGVAAEAQGDTMRRAEYFEEATRSGRRFAGSNSARADLVSQQMLYNTAFFRMKRASGSEKEKAAKEFGEFLRACDPLSQWWDPAYTHYSSLCSELGMKTEAQAELKKQFVPAFLPVRSIMIGDGVEIILGEPANEVREALRDCKTELPRMRGTNLVKIKCPARDIEVLAADRVLAVFLVGRKAPVVEIQPRGSGTAAARVMVGMKRWEFEKLLGDDSSSYDEVTFISGGKPYRYYRSLGISIRLNPARQVIEEIVVAPV
jgi:hypothetical protein